MPRLVKPKLLGKSKDGRAMLYRAGANVLLSHLKQEGRKFNLIFGDV